MNARANSVFALLGWGWLAALLPAQTLSTASSTTTPAQLIAEKHLPTQVRKYVQAFGDRVTRPGKERTVLNGTYSTASGSGLAQLTWEAPGSLRFDRGDQPAKPLIYDASVNVARTTDAAQSEIVESLLDDSAEWFFYSFSRGAAHRYLGSGFRSDDGSTPNYAGPWHDIYVVSAPATAEPGSALREKFYYFDSQTKFLWKVRYQVNESLMVTTEYSDWTVQQGNAYPGKIVRKVNGAEVFSFVVTSAGAGPSAADGKFAAQ